MRRFPLLAMLLAACAAPRPVADPAAGPEQVPVEFSIEGAGELSERAMERVLRQELEDLDAQELTLAHVDDAAFALEEWLREEGFPEARVKFAWEQGDGLPLFRVDAGTQCILRRIEVRSRGEELPDEQIRAAFEGPRTGLLGRGEPIYIARRVAAAPRNLQQELMVRGYDEARVEVIEQRFSDDGSELTLVVEVEQGPRQMVQGIGARDLLTRSLVPGFAQLAEDFPFRERPDGERERIPYSPRVLAALRAEILSRLGDLGYPDTLVRLEAEPVQGGRRLVVQARPGPRVRFAGVRFEGDPRTDTDFLRSRVILEDGAWYDESARRESTSRLYGTGFYSRVDVDLVGEGQDRELVYTLEPRSTREVWVEPGYGSYEQLRLRAGARDRNFLGTGRTLKGEVSLAQRAQEARLTLMQPWFLREELTADLSAEAERRELPSFTRESLGIGAFLTRDWDPAARLSTSLGYELRATRATAVDVGAGAPVNLDTDRSANVGAIKLAQVIEQRDSPLLPRKGWAFKASIEWADAALASELDFTRLQWNASHLRPLSESTVLALGARAGVAYPTGGEELPLQERFFNGGENQVRAFRETFLGPTDAEGNPAGGEAMWTANLELRQDVLTQSLHAALFVDVGAVAVEAADWLAPEDPRWGYGVGLRYLLPVGPLRLDLGLNPEARGDEDDWILHLSIGMPF